MEMHGKVLSGVVQTLTTKKGERLNKTRLKVLDVGAEVAGDVQVYWIDFLGEVALSESEMAAVQHQEVVIDIRRINPTLGKDGKAYLNISGGALVQNGQVVQTALRTGAGQKTA